MIPIPLKASLGEWKGVPMEKSAPFPWQYPHESPRSLAHLGTEVAFFAFVIGSSVFGGYQIFTASAPRPKVKASAPTTES